MKTKDLQAGLGDPKDRPGVEDAKVQLRERMTPRLETYRADLKVVSREWWKLQGGVISG